DHTGIARAHLERPQHVLLEVRHRAQPVYLGPLDRELGVDRLGHQRQALLLDAIASFELQRLVFGQGRLVARHAAVRAQRLGDLGVALRLQVFGARGRHEARLREALILEIGSLAHEIGAGCREVLLGLEGLDLNVRVGEVEQHRLRRHMLPRLREHAIDAAGGERRDEADVLRHERAGPPHLAHHLAAAHRIDPQRGPVDARCRGFEAGEKNGEQQDRRGGDPASQVTAVLRHWRAGNVHDYLTKQTSYHEPAKLSCFQRTDCRRGFYPPGARRVRLWDGQSHKRTPGPPTWPSWSRWRGAYLLH